AETLLGGAGADSIVLGAAVLGASIDLGGGNDRLTLAGAANTATVANVETLIGGSGDDTITLRASRVSADLGAGNDRLTLADTPATVTVANVETLTGGAAADTVTLAGALAPSAMIDLNG